MTKNKQNKNTEWPIKGPKVEPYIIDKSNLVKLIIFTALFCLAFVNLYKPFSSEDWMDMSSFQYFLFSCLLVFIGIVVVAISRYFMFLFVQRFQMYYAELIIWSILEIIILSGIYTLYVIWMRPDLDFWNWHDVAIVFKDVNINTFLVIFLPYLVSWLYFSYDDKRKRLRELERRGLVRNGPSVLQFNDEKGEVKFSVSFENVIYIESADNYIEINYLAQGKPSKYMLRNSMKRIEIYLIQTSIQRCHRSYMVNFEHVTAMRKDNDDIVLELDVPSVKKIPVSKTYVNKATEAFMSHGRRKGFPIRELEKM